MVQTCEDIVHTDEPSESGPVTTVLASTRPFPEWWSSVEDGRPSASRKRSSILKELILERNISFWDDSGSPQGFSESCEQMFMVNSNLATVGEDTVLGILSGNGGVQIDLVLYILPRK